MVDECARKAHARGMKAVAYYPVLESLTPMVAQAPGSMAKDHPDWMQMDMQGKPNVFIGGGGRVFWVEIGTESAWTCPNSGYGDYFIGRIARLAGTALDGIWGDVPLFSDIAGTEWPCACRHCKARFLAETGLTLPSQANWNDPVFRRWVIWRHRVIWDFEQKILAGARKVRPDFEVIIETVTMDYSGGTAQGLDGASHDDGQVIRVWEVDVVSDRSSMREASADDWMDMAVMMKHGAGCSAPRPSWVFCYGLEASDAEPVLAVALATGNNPFECKIPLMTTSVGPAYRTRMFKWLQGETSLYASYPLHHAAVLYSSASRDFLDRNASVGLYSSFNPSDTLWWATDEQDAVANLAYVGDYRGWCRALLRNHIPYDVLPPWRVSAEALSRYRLLVVPSAVALSDATVQLLVNFANNGGTLVASGPDLGIYDENGAARPGPALLTALGVSPTGDWARKTLGKGAVVHGASRAGQQYLRGESQRASMEVVLAATSPQLVTNAPAATVFSTRRTRDGKTMMLVAANFDGLGATRGSFVPREASFNLAMSLEGRRATRVVASQPGSAAVPIGFQMIDGRVQFPMKMGAVSIVSVTVE